MTTEAAEAVVHDDEEGPVYFGRVIIEWPKPLRPGSGALQGWRCTIYDAETGKCINSVMKIDGPSVAVHSDAQRWVTADLTMFADEAGMPVLFPDELKAVPGSSVPVFMDEDGHVRWGTFSFLVTEMRVRS